MKKDEVYFKAMLARDPRFDGKFFVGVKTTGMYCRPICPAKPKRENVEFFASAWAAEKAGYRPCLRCRPESAPRSPAWIGTSATVQRALKMIHQPECFDWDENQFAALFGVSARHLRRLFQAEIGKTPKQLSFENRLNLSRQLIVETSLPMTEIAAAAGFRSIRRFNAAFKDRFHKKPSEFRRRKASPQEPLRVFLSYRPPFHFESLLGFYRAHQMGDLESFSPGRMTRVVSLNGKAGTVSISNDPENSRLQVEIEFPDPTVIQILLAKVRMLFDLDSDPLVIANGLEQDLSFKKMLRRHPGIRLPSGWDPFEVAIATILGQLISVERARTLVADLIEIAGSDSGLSKNGKQIRLFPTPAQIVAADLSGLKSTRARKETLVRFSQALIDGQISLESTQDVDLFMKNVLALKGIGPWTANYMALKVLRHTDAFPATDLILARALEKHPPAVLEKMRPWRGYAAVLLWMEYAYKEVP